MKPAKEDAEHHFEVFDGRGVATVWTCRKCRSGRTEIGAYVGTIYGVHTEDEARAAFARGGAAEG